MPSKSMFGHVIEEIWSLSGAFHKCSFGRVKREATSLLIPFLKELFYLQILMYGQKIYHLS